MSVRAIREFDGKRLIGVHLSALGSSNVAPVQAAQIQIQLTMPRLTPAAVATLDPSTPIGETEIEALSSEEIKRQVEKTLVKVEQEQPWVTASLVVVKPDQLIKRRGKAGLVLLNATWKQACNWIVSNAGREVIVDGVSGNLKTFIVEPQVEHQKEEEFYLCLQSKVNGDEILFCKEGGIDVGDVDSKAKRLLIPIEGQPTIEQVKDLLEDTGPNREKIACIAGFIVDLFKIYVELNFTYLEINPLVIVGDKIFILDVAAKLDQTAEYECGKKWTLEGRPVEFPAPFGRELTPEEAYIAELDAKTGASLKLTILNKDGRIWTMVAGGGASVAYSDAIASLGMAYELANYGEYSGAPSETQTYEYSKTILDLMTRGTPHPQGKILFIGGGIANFTNVAATFKGIIRSLQEYRHRLIQHGVSIFVRRGGPNYQEGLKMMRELGDNLGVPINVFGPDTHITAIVPMALKPMDTKAPPVEITMNLKGEWNIIDQIVQPTPSNSSRSGSPIKSSLSTADPLNRPFVGEPEVKRPYQLFDKTTRSFIYGMQQRAVQGMLDYDYICKRKTPSVAAIIYPFGGDHVMKFYWGTIETLIPVYSKLDEACARHPEVRSGFSILTVFVG